MSAPTPSTPEKINQAELKLLALRDWSKRGLIEPGEARKMRMRITKQMADLE
ncbi:hypothetical protein AB0M02_29045 [Actinoplanes sp. NPDC051861]|uniref:hypothetical protein n=1 Tax=Actinoplanes sp. NPDC051861 TaxID=3155170 RepID=UPI0034317EDB